MPSIQVLHVADTHLGYRQYNIVERERDLYEVFEEIIETALREHVDMVIHSGDFFDSYRPPPQAILAAIKPLRLLKEKNIPVYTILGDHDTPKRIAVPPLLLLEELGYLKVLGYKHDKANIAVRVRARSAETYVAGISNLKGVAIKALSERLKLASSPPRDKPSILILHQALKDASPFYEITLQDMPKGYSYYALGHIHSFYKARIGEAAVVYPGAPEILRADEIPGDGKGVVLAELSAKGTISVQRIILKRVRPQHRLEVEANSINELREKLNKILASLNPSGAKKPLIHIHIKGQVTASKKKLYTLIESVLSSKVLAYRLSIEASKPSETSSPQTISRQGIDTKKILAEKLGDEKLADLAYTLLTVLGLGEGRRSIDEAMRLVKNYAKTRYGVEL